MLNKGSAISSILPVMYQNRTDAYDSKNKSLTPRRKENKTTETVLEGMNPQLRDLPWSGPLMILLEVRTKPRRR